MFAVIFLVYLLTLSILLLLINKKSFKFHKVMLFNFQLQLSLAMIWITSNNVLDIKFQLLHSFTVFKFSLYAYYLTLLIGFLAFKIVRTLVKRNYSEQGRVSKFFSKKRLYKVFFVLFSLPITFETFYFSQQLLQGQVYEKIIASTIFIKNLFLIALLFSITHQNFIFLINKKQKKKNGYCYQGIKIYTHQKPHLIFTYFTTFTIQAAILIFSLFHTYIYVYFAVLLQLVFCFDLCFRSYPESLLWHVDLCLGNVLTLVQICLFTSFLLTKERGITLAMIVITAVYSIETLTLLFYKERFYKEIRVEDKQSTLEKRESIVIPYKKTIQQTNNQYDPYLKKKRISENIH